MNCYLDYRDEWLSVLISDNGSDCEGFNQAGLYFFIVDSCVIVSCRKRDPEGSLIISCSAEIPSLSSEGMSEMLSTNRHHIIGYGPVFSAELTETGNFIVEVHQEFYQSDYENGMINVSVLIELLKSIMETR